jgi:uncharacterized membrane protein
LTVEEAIKAIMSAGIVAPHSFSISSSDMKLEKEPVENLERVNYSNSKMEGGS